MVKSKSEVAALQLRLQQDDIVTDVGAVVVESESEPGLCSCFTTLAKKVAVVGAWYKHLYCKTKS